MEGLAYLAIAVFAAGVLGVAILILIHKMIDGELPAGAGIGGIVVIFFLLAMCVKPVSDWIPTVILIMALASMVLFPFAADQLEKAELRALDTERLIKAYNAFAQRPDNVSAAFEVSRGLYVHGMRGHAIALATRAMGTLSQAVDPIQNRSFRDSFRSEEYMLKNWNRGAAKSTEGMAPIACPNCGHLNPLGVLICEKCSRAYLLDVAHNMNIRPRIYGKLVISFAALTATIVLGALAGLLLKGALTFLGIGLIVATTGGLFYWLYRPPRPG